MGPRPVKDSGRGFFFSIYFDNPAGMIQVPRMSNISRLSEIEAAFRFQRDSADCPVAFECLCVIASGYDNANRTLGDVQDEEWAALVIRSVECLLETESAAVQRSFKELGLSW